MAKTWLVQLDLLRTARKKWRSKLIEQIEKKIDEYIFQLLRKKELTFAEYTVLAAKLDELKAAEAREHINDGILSFFAI